MNRRFLSLIVTPVVIALASVSNATAQESDKTKTAPKSVENSAPDREAIENIVRAYLLKNPSVIREAMQALQVQEEKQKRESAAANMKLLRSEIYSDADTPGAGNAAGDISVVVFYDYFCGYCKRTLPALDTLLVNDHAVRIIYKEFPILGPQSLAAAKAALAAGRQGKFIEFHRELINADGAGEDVIRAASERLGLDYAKLQKDMLDPKIGAAIDRNIRLAEALNINGTPAYLVGDRLIPGAIGSESLARLIRDERAKLAKVELEKSGPSATVKGTN